ncbi:MAG: hypothetical protein B6I25_01745 [Planctomycetales bacterium 4572_13]|nr:MAG: hypothetical protein B6I25_01745 [Planctomycetales bacterium 4572_13]
MRRFLIAVVLIMVVLSGCGGSKQTIGRSQTPTKGQISKEELRNELDKFEYSFISRMRQTIDSINAASGTRRSKRSSTRMQTKIVESLHAMTASDDAVTAFFDTWGLVVRLRLYFEKGAGQSAYGDQQSQVIAFINTAEENIDRIGQLFLKPKQFEELKKSIYRFAQQYPIERDYASLVVYATQQEESEAGVLMQTLRIPMAPIRALEGVDNTANAISKVSDSIGRFTDIAEQMPESTRWQMSILVDDFEESEMTQSFLESLNDFSQSSTQLVEVLDTMPEQMPKDPNAPPGFGMRDFDTLLLNAGQTADKVGNAVAQIQQTVDAAEMQKQLRLLIDHIIWRLFELVLAVLVLVWGSRFIIKKLQTAKAKKNQ